MEVMGWLRSMEATTARIDEVSAVGSMRDLTMRSIFIASALCKRPADFETGGIREAVHARVVDDADDGSPHQPSRWIGPAVCESFADRVLSREQIARETGVD